MVFTGSIGQKLQGMNLQPHDVEIQTNQEGAYIINDLLQDYCYEKVYFRESSMLSLHFGNFKYNDARIEVI
jgi:hypothetical protein